MCKDMRYPRAYLETHGLKCYKWVLKAFYAGDRTINDGTKDRQWSVVGNILEAHYYNTEYEWATTISDADTMN